MSTFQNAAAYERYMGGWSRAAGESFLDWLALPPGLRWLDVGCGSGAFTALLAERAAPAELHGIDRAPAMLAHARDRLRENVQLHEGDATALPFATARFDVAVMPLVIVFIDDPGRAVAEMRRVVRPGGTVATYIWDLPQGFPYYTAFAILRTSASCPTAPPQTKAPRCRNCRRCGNAPDCKTSLPLPLACASATRILPLTGRHCRTAPASANASPPCRQRYGKTCMMRCVRACPSPLTAALPLPPAPMRYADATPACRCRNFTRMTQVRL